MKWVCNTGCLYIIQREAWQHIIPNWKVTPVNVSGKSAIPSFSLYLEKYSPGISGPEGFPSAFLCPEIICHYYGQMSREKSLMGFYWQKENKLKKKKSSNTIIDSYGMIRVIQEELLLNFKGSVNEVPEFKCSCLLAISLPNPFLKQQQECSCTHITCCAQWEKGQNLPNFKDAAHHEVPDYVNHLGAFPLWSDTVGTPVLPWSRNIFSPALPAFPTLCIVPSTSSDLSPRQHSTVRAGSSFAWSCLGSKASGTNQSLL